MSLTRLYTLQEKKTTEEEGREQEILDGEKSAARNVAADKRLVVCA